KKAIEDHFDYSIELERNLSQSGKKTVLKQVRAIAEMAEISYIRQKEARGLGHAILTARHLIGDEPFVVLLPDDIITGPVPAVRQMIQVHNRNQGPVVGVQPVPKAQTSLYGIIKADRINPNLFRVTDMVEKPKPEKAPSTLAVVGRYLLTPEIFDIIENTRPGKNQEVQLTDALRALAQKRVLYARQLDGDRYDAGDKLGFLKATVELGLKQPDLGKAFHRFLKDLKF
ncbi:MAG TPA: UTP--glucose-1-phosphate uridylyltransferase, partial [Nitrospiria bacterium]|nr:UTP--glucose-1-phosphate uridylyltransferase [Nitrospiria bacterium]